MQIRRHLFCTLGYSLILHYLFIAQIAPGLASENSFSWLLRPIDITTSLSGVLLFSVLPYFLALEDSIGLSCIFPAPVLESAISSKESGSFYWKILLLMTNPGCWVWSLLLGGFLGSRSYELTEQWNRIVYMNPRIYTYLYIFCMQSSVFTLLNNIFKSIFLHQFKPYPIDTLIGIKLNLQIIWGCEFFCKSLM